MPRACPKSVCHFFQLALALGACRVTEPSDGYLEGLSVMQTSCSGYQSQRGGKLLCGPVLFPVFSLPPPALLHPHRQVSRGQTNLHALLHSSHSLLCYLLERQTHRKGRWHSPTRVRGRMDTNRRQEVLGACKGIKESVGSRSGQEAELCFVSLGDSLRNFTRGVT